MQISYCSCRPPGPSWNTTLERGDCDEAREWLLLGQIVLEHWREKARPHTKTEKKQCLVFWLLHFMYRSSRGVSNRSILKYIELRIEPCFIGEIYIWRKWHIYSADKFIQMYVKWEQKKSHCIIPSGAESYQMVIPVGRAELNPSTLKSSCFWIVW